MTNLHPTTHLRAAAWVPDEDPNQPWDEAVLRAADWIWGRSEMEDIAPLLVTTTLKNGTFMEPLAEIARSGGHAAPQGKQCYTPGPVLAYVPDARSLSFALDLSRGSSLVVVESHSFPLSEWAAGAGAVNLLTGEVSPSTISGDVLNDLDSVVFFGGRNGWTGSHEKQHARSHLDRHVQIGQLSPDEAAAYVMSQGASARGAKRLKNLLESARR